MKKLILLLLILSSMTAMSQTTVTIGINDSSNTPFEYPCPIQDFYYATRAQYLYTASELSAMGISQGAIITEIGWVVDTSFTTGHLIEDYSISLLNTGVTNLAINSWEQGSTLVYGPTNYSYPAGYGGNVIFPVSPFYYSGGNLIVEICGGLPSGGYTENPLCRLTTNLPFTASHQWRQDLATGCGTTDPTNYANETSRPLLVLSFFPANLNLPTIEGDVYYDQNQNGAYDGGELKLTNQLVAIAPIGYYGLTDINGHYKLYLDSGNYTSSYSPPQPWVLTSLPSSYSISLPPNSLNNDFGIWAPDSLVNYTQQVTYLTGTMRCNVQGHSELYLYHTGLFSENGTVTLIHSANLPFDSNTSTQGFTLSGDTVQWTYSSFLPGQTLDFHGNFNNGQAGDTVTFTYIDSVFDDNWNFKHVYSNSFTFIVTCSFDPNDKAVDPAGETSAHYTLMSEELQYTIRFQNTGNDTAFNVKILDTLDANLDLTTLQVLATSHPMTLQMSQTGAVQFIFDNILLPDHIVDEPGSNGYVVYKIQHQNVLAEGTTIYNTAHIVFDMNAPVVTNTTYNNFVSSIPTGIAENSLRMSGYIYPNPTAGQSWVVLNNDSKEKHHLDVYNSIGDKIFSTNFSGNKYLLKEKLSAGIYFVSVSGENGIIFSSKIISK